MLPALPQPPPAPTPPVFHKPKYGEDWEGQQPHRVALPEFVPAEIPPEPSELHLEVPEPELQQVTPEMALEPWVKLTWHAGPEEEAPQVGDGVCKQSVSASESSSMSILVFGRTRIMHCQTA